MNIACHIKGKKHSADFTIDHCGKPGLYFLLCLSFLAGEWSDSGLNIMTGFFVVGVIFITSQSLLSQGVCLMRSKYQLCLSHNHLLADWNVILNRSKLFVYLKQKHKENFHLRLHYFTISESTHHQMHHSNRPSAGMFSLD